MSEQPGTGPPTAEEIAEKLRAVYDRALTRSDSAWQSSDGLEPTVADLMGVALHAAVGLHGLIPGEVVPPAVGEAQLAVVARACRRLDKTAASNLAEELADAFGLDSWDEPSN